LHFVRTHILRVRIKALRHFSRMQLGRIVLYRMTVRKMTLGRMTIRRLHLGRMTFIRMSQSRKKT